LINEICQKIKDRRKELGYSLEYTVERTKLYPSVIRDIEEGRLENINSAYIKGFLKIYAAFLNVDLENCLEEITQVSLSTDTRKRTKSGPSKNIFKTIIQLWAKVPSQVKRKIVVVLIGIALLWSFLNAVKFISNKIFLLFKKKPIEQAKQINTPSIPAVLVEQKSGASVIVSANKECYLSVLSDGKLVFKGFLHRGDIETWLGNKEVELKINDGSAVDLEINGKSIPKLASTPKPIKSLKITPTGISVDK